MRWLTQNQNERKDLPNISEKLQFFLFADDTNIYYESKDLKELEKTVNIELKQVDMSGPPYLLRV